MLWVTRNFVHVDRVACPWLIKRFVDKQAQFIFLPAEEIPEFAKKTGAIPYDVSGAELTHYERDGAKFCSFDSIVEKYKLTEDKALQKLREIVNAADTGKMKEFPLALGLEAIASGAPLMVDSDHDALAVEFPLYDSLYTFFQRNIVYNENKETMKGFKNRAEASEFIKRKIKELKSLKK